ncbi:hypothetical protein [Aquimarina celericrescens]|uniref:Uncharacterized protein n=1 Tax=Aquimarina celericrescens TaxID=1964542 RepID=A0ABW5AY96_9FLAO|nr:hypothetical protein [Aquimarina celericrescens]
MNRKQKKMVERKIDEFVEFKTPLEKSRKIAQELSVELFGIQKAISIKVNVPINFWNNIKILIMKIKDSFLIS